MFPMDKLKDNKIPQNQGNNLTSDANIDAVDMLRLRYWQHLINEMLKRKQFKIPIHLAFGHEAVAVALDRCVEPDDAICLTHRNIAYNLARLRSLDSILGHYRLISTPVQPGLMGSMNLAAEHTSIAYTSSVLGNNLPVAMGIAMNRKLAGRSGVVFVLTGDGAMEEGAFWETCLFARSHHLGLVIIVENNNYSMSSTIDQRRSGIDLAQVCSGVGLRYHHAKGAIFADTKRAISAARVDAASGNPACIELELTTFNQHAGPTPGWPGDSFHIALDDGLLVKDSPEDPIYHIRQALGAAMFERLVNQIMKADCSDKYLH